LPSCFPRPHFVHEVTRAEELAERRRARRVDHAGLEVEEHCAGQQLSARGLVDKQVHAVELRVVVAVVHAAAADAELVAPTSQNLLPIWLPHWHLHVQHLARRSSLVAGTTREKKSGEELKKKGAPCGSVAQETENAGGARTFITNGRMK
jgi:hypothetical protein